MSLVINTNNIANTVQRNLQTNQANLQKSLARLSSGSKIVDPTDDAGGLAVSMKLTASLNRNVRAQQNVQNSLSFLQTQDGAMANAARILDRMSELKTMSLDVTKNSLDNANYDAEFNQLQNQLTNIKSESFNGIDLFTTSDSDLTVYTTEQGDTGTSSVSSPYQIERIQINGDAELRKYDFTAIAGDAGDNYDFVFTTADGNSTYSLSVAWNTNATTTVTDIKSAIESHSELKNLVTVSDNGSGAFHIEGQAGAGNFTLAAQANDNGTGTTAALTVGTDVAFDADTFQFDVDGNTIGPVAWAGSKSATAAAIVAAVEADATVAALVSARVDGDDVVLTSKAAGANSITVNGSTVVDDAAAPVAASLVINQDAAGSSTTSTTSTAAPSVDMSRHLVFQTGTNGSGLITSNGVDLLDSSSATSMNLADYTVEDFTTFIQNVATARAQNGAESARLSASHDLLKTNNTNLDAARSALQDADIAIESTKLARNNILVQSSAAMLSQANASQNIALQLLG